MSNEFNQALSNFINDFAGGGAIRHLADSGYTVGEICEKIDYPMPKNKVAEIVWKHYIDIGKICLEEPGTIHKEVSYVKEQDSYGHISMRRVVKEQDISDKKYVVVDFGKQIYQDLAAFEKSLEGLDKKDKDYILDLPWPLTPVYHESDERMNRILRIRAGILGYL